MVSEDIKGFMAEHTYDFGYYSLYETYMNSLKTDSQAQSQNHAMEITPSEEVTSGGDSNTNAESPRFEGELYSSLDPITIEYDGYHFIVICPALGLPTPLSLRTDAKNSDFAF